MDLARACELLDDDPIASAAEAGLRYVSDEAPGYGRRRRGRGFSYVDAKGRGVTSPRLRQRFDALAIPPAWTEVWICRNPRAHLQATGRDEAGRKQYIYHPLWRAARDRYKYDRVVAFGTLLPRIRERVCHDLESESGLTRKRVLASVVRLLETTLIRVGNDEYARKNESYGLTTLRKKHVEHDDERSEVRFEFEGKSGREWSVAIDDPHLVEVIVDCLETPGHELFKYFDDEGHRCSVSSDEVNAYLRDIAGAKVSAKDFRTWAGTVKAAVALEELAQQEPEVKHEKRVVRAIAQVAEELGNTPSICRSSYVHPAVLAEDSISLDDPALQEGLQRTLQHAAEALEAEEVAVLSFLEEKVAASESS